MDGNTFVARFAPTVSRVARGIAKSNPGIEASDIEQEIYVRALQPAFLNRVTDSDEALVYTLANEYGIKYARAERQFYTYNSANYIYTPEDIRTLLEDAFFNPVHWEETPKKEVDTSIRSGGVVVALWDISETFKALNANDQRLIRERYQFGLEYATDAERKATNRAVDKMTKTLNGIVISKASADHDGIGSRAAMSNAEAAYATSFND